MERIFEFDAGKRRSSRQHRCLRGVEEVADVEEVVDIVIAGEVVVPFEVEVVVHGSLRYLSEETLSTRYGSGSRYSSHPRRRS